MQQVALAPLKKLSSGFTIPTAGLGLYKCDQKKIQEVIEGALEVGYRHFDTAILYENEEFVGESFENIFKKGVYKREDIFITSKVFPYKKDNIVEKVEESLKKLKTNYIDLYLLHWPCLAPNPEDNTITHKPVSVAYAELEECVQKGYVKSIGVSNYNVQLLFDLLSYCKIKPVMNQVELHVYLQQPNLVKFCKQFNIAVTAYCPLGRGGDMFQDPVIQKLSEKYKKTPAQIMLNHLNVNLDIIVIPKTERVERLKENFDWRDFKLEESEIQELINIDKNFRLINPVDRPWMAVPIFD